MEDRKVQRKRKKPQHMKSLTSTLQQDLIGWKKINSPRTNSKKPEKGKGSIRNHRVNKRAFKKNKHGLKETSVTMRNKIALSVEDNSMRLSLLDDVNKPSVIKETLDKYKYRSDSLNSSLAAKNKSLKHKVLQRDRKLTKAVELAARTEILRGETAGFLEADPGESTDQFTQKEIQKAVDITSATKHFELHLDMGPYRVNYSRDGRYLLLGGKKGHIAAFDWFTKHLMTEVGVMEDVFDVQWLHRETMFAAAQKQWVYIYDRSGVELHCMRNIFRPIRMTYLPFHMLLVTASDSGFLSWLDTSMGSLVTNTKTGRGRSNVLEQNPQNAVVCLGDCKGVVTMWSPSLAKPLVSQLCHTAPVKAITIDVTGKYMVTGGANRQACVWDLRKFGDKPLWDLRFENASPSHLAFSQRSLLAVALDNIVEVYRNTHTMGVTDCYLRHRANRQISSLEFAGWEDVLGVGSQDGFTSMLVPGAGEPNLDGLIGQPMAARQQRREAEVKALLDKLPPETITLDPNALLKPHVPTAAESLAAAHTILKGNVPKFDVKLKNKTKRRIHASKVKGILKAKNKREFGRELSETKNVLLERAGIKGSAPKQSKQGALDRFRQKTSK